MTAAHKNVNEDIRDEGKKEHTQRIEEAVRTGPGQCSIEGRKTMKPPDMVLLTALFSGLHSMQPLSETVLRSNTLTFR